MFRTFLVFCELAWVILVKNKRATKKLYAELNAYLAARQLQLTEQHKKRIWFYTAQSAITNYWFATLRGYKPTRTEAKNAIYLGAFTPIADDLMDVQNITFEELQSIEIKKDADALLFHYLNEKLKSVLHEKPLFAHYFKLAHAAQNVSLKQLSTTPLPTGTLKQITYNKGGYYTTLYRMVLQNPPQQNEEKAIYLLGSILQLLNDLFDIHKDFHNGVQTLVTANPDMRSIAKRLAGLSGQFKTVFYGLNYPLSRKKKAYRAIMAIVSRGDVALAHYQKLQGEAAALPIAQYGRKPLIVDMEKLGNIRKNLHACHAACRNTP